MGVCKLNCYLDLFFVTTDQSTAAARNRLLEETKALLEVTGYPYFVTAMSKGFAPENLPSFGGVYGGASTLPEVKKVVESSDCALWLGSYPVRNNFRL